MPGPPPKLPPRKTVTIRVDRHLLDWAERNIPRSMSLSSYVSAALAEKIEREKKTARSRR